MEALKPRLTVVINEPGTLGIADGGIIGPNNVVYCTATRNSQTLKNEVLNYLKRLGYRVEKFEIIIRDMRK